MNRHTEPPRSLTEPQVVLRSPADLAEALPYLLGFHPDDSIVMVAMHGARGRFGGRLRLGIPAAPEEWPHVAAQLADCLVNGAGQHGRPEGIAVFLCQEPRPGESPAQTMERLRPLAQHLRTACGALDVPVLEALCVSADRWWSYCCPDTGCCPPEGTAVKHDGTSVVAAAAAYAGIQVRGSLRDLQARFSPLAKPHSDAQEAALDAACAELLPRMLDGGTDSRTVRQETLALAGAALQRFQAAPRTGDDRAADALDDSLLGDDEAAAVILGLQDRDTRDAAAEWMEGPEAAPALRLWRALARRCVGAYAGHAAPPLTLAGWVCWSLGDEPSARAAFGLALEADSDYTFAKLLHQACNQRIDPEPLRRCLREERGKRLRPGARPGGSARAGTGPRNRSASDARPSPRPAARSRSGRRAKAEGDEPG